MPIYEYLCSKCNKVSEVLQKFSDKPISKCPQCGGRVKKLMSHNSFQLKGSGWYVTDYKNSSKPQDESSAPKDESSADVASIAETPSDAASLAGD